MTWDDLLDRLRRTGHRPRELDFMADYGPIALRRHPGLEGRRFRCLFGSAKVDGDLDFDAYLFPSAGDAKEFHRLAGAEDGWHQAGNIVFRTDPRSLKRLLEILLEIVEETR